ncbi:MAG: restriction endonuclease [Candidatus Saccharimonadales bacterium]
MSRYSRAQRGDTSFIFIILVGAAAWTHRAQLVDIAYVGLYVIVCLLLLRLCWILIARRRFAKLRDIDSMNGLDFEQYVAGLLRKNGFHNVSLTERYDFGVDIIAEKDGVRWGIQAKRHSGLVKAAAVRQVVTGLRLYNCDQAMVITNSTYSVVARRLATGNDCVLVDRMGLMRLKNNRGVIL